MANNTQPIAPDIDFERDLSRDLPRSIKVAIAEVVLAWSFVDGGVNRWITRAFGLTSHRASVLVGAMQTKSRLEKLQNLYKLEKNNRLRTEAKEISRIMGSGIDTRNLICHVPCIGVHKRDRTRAAFMTQRPNESSLEYMEIVWLSLDDMEQSRGLADEIKERLRPILSGFESGGRHLD